MALPYLAITRFYGAGHYFNTCTGYVFRYWPGQPVVPVVVIVVAAVVVVGAADAELAVAAIIVSVTVAVVVLVFIIGVLRHFPRYYTTLAN